MNHNWQAVNHYKVFLVLTIDNQLVEKYIFIYRSADGIPLCRVVCMDTRDLFTRCACKEAPCILEVKFE